MTKKLVEGKNWAEAVRDCLSKVESWSHHQNPDTERVHMAHVDKLMALDPVPCNEPCYSKLKVNLFSDVLSSVNCFSALIFPIGVMITILIG